MDDDKVAEETAEQAEDRYFAAMHAVQSGVAMMQQFNASETSPKSLRVGVNATMVEHSALIGLLIKKGILTNPEWLTAMADAAEGEVKRYEQDLSEIVGTHITLA